MIPPKRDKTTASIRNWARISQDLAPTAFRIPISLVRSLTERTKEIGIRKAVGATKKAIINQFLAEAIFVCQIGGVIGMILGLGAGNFLAYVIDASVVIPIWSVIGSFMGMLFIGIVFGVYPAFKAAQLDPIESLRYE